MSGQKKCITCGKIKTVNMFYCKKRGVSEYEGECKVCRKIRSRRYWCTTGRFKKEPCRIHSLKNKYGITIEQYDKMHKSQNGVCSICGNPEMTKYKDRTTQRLSIDHDHKTGLIRGLLCRKCNTSLSAFEDDIDILASAISYLVNNKIRKAS